MNAPDHKTLLPGLHQIPMTSYLALKALSSGMCHSILTYSPAHALYWQEHQDVASEAIDTGTAIHDALLEGIDRIVPVDAPDWRTKAAKEARDAARAAGLIPMLAHKVPSVRDAVGAARTLIEASSLVGIFDCGKPEQTLVWREGDLVCKARPDWLTDDGDVLLHVKTTKGSANPPVWIRTQLEGMGYDCSTAFYARGLNAVSPRDADSTEHVFLVIEQEAPHGCSLVGLDPAMWEIADAKVGRAIRTWQQCIASGMYPGYSSSIHYAEPRPWQLAEAEERAADEVYGALDGVHDGVIQP
jgi:hypothetical protein